MTQKTKLEIIDPYTPEHPGPYAIDSAISSEVRFVKVNIHCVVDGIAFVTTEDRDVPWCVKTSDLMNAREVPVAREFWMVGSLPFSNKECAIRAHSQCLPGLDLELIHVREVLPGDEV